jgi:large subunit ribosomal protein L25
MSDLKINAEPRTKFGGNSSRMLRAEGRVPGVLYGHGEPSIPFHVKELDLRSLIYTNETHVVSLAIGGKETRCILRDSQFDPISDRVVHVDFLILHAGEKIKVDVPVTLVGTAIGARDGGIIDFILHKVTIDVLPDSIPEHIDVDISNLAIGQSIHIRDLAKTDKYVIVGDETSIIVACNAPKTTDDTAVAATEVVEPEQIKAKGKKEEEA